MILNHDLITYLNQLIKIIDTILNLFRKLADILKVYNIYIFYDLITMFYKIYFNFFYFFLHMSDSLIYFSQNCPVTRNTASVTIAVELENISDVMEGENAHMAGGHICVGNADNKTILFEKFRL